ncbi:MAG: ABC transporter ATP-binding protein/permease [Butyrivibrio sp.]|nr:ABC transporter ATP-binding protein/permease [Butyrivibrio sp.]
MSRKDWKKVFAMMENLAANHKDVLISLAGLSISSAVRPFISVILMGMLVDAAYAGMGLKELLRYVVIGVAGIFVMQAIEGIMVMYFNRKLEYMQEIQAQPLNKKSMEMDYEYLEDSEVHEMRQRIERFGDWSLMARVLSNMNKILTSAFTVLIAVFVAVPMFISSSHSISEGFVGSWLMSALLLTVVLMLAFAEFKLGRHFNGKQADIRKEMAGYEAKYKYYLDILSGSERQKDLRICKQQRLYDREFEKIASGERKIMDKMAHFVVLNVFSQQSASALTGFLVYTFAGLLAYMGMISVGGAVTYAASILRFTEAMGRLVYVISWLGGNAVFAGDYIKYMALPQRKHAGCIPLEKRRDNRFLVEFEHVSFKYPGSDVYVIKDLNLKFEIGEKMAVVGRNGSGKTTFIKLLCRLYDVTEGCIKVNGIDIRKYDYEEYSNLFAVVFQDFQVFAFPLGENVAAGLSVDKECAVDALERAGMGERYRLLPDGLDTCIGKDFVENGVTFSGGEKQKIAIARAIYKDAPFVIMDEPTAALDPESECEVYAGFDKMVGNKTSIYISHRLASCRFCQDILVFDKGKVVQRGRHEELEGQEGLYKELWEAQAQYYA